MLGVVSLRKGKVATREGKNNEGLSLKLGLSLAVV